MDKSLTIMCLHSSLMFLFNFARYHYKMLLCYLMNIQTLESSITALLTQHYFYEFALKLVAVIRCVKEAVQNQFCNLLEQIAELFQGMFALLNIIQEWEHNNIWHLSQITSILLPPPRSTSSLRQHHTLPSSHIMCFGSALHCLGPGLIQV